MFPSLFIEAFANFLQPCDQLGHAGKCQYSIAAINHKRFVYGSESNSRLEIIDLSTQEHSA